MDVFGLEFDYDLENELKFAKSAIRIEKVTKDANIGYFTVYGSEKTMYGVAYLWESDNDNFFLLEVNVGNYRNKIPVPNDVTAKDIKDKIMQIIESKSC